MNSFEFEKKMASVVLNERKSTREVLEMINLAFERRHHLEQGYSSLFDYLTKAHGYSEGSAQRRIQAAKLLRAVPEISSKIEDGSLNLTSLSKAQTLIQAQERISKEKVQISQKEQILELIENKSTDQAEKVLLEIFPDLSEVDQGQTLTRVSPNTSKYTAYFDDETLNDLERAKELLSHVLPNGNITDVIKHVVKDFLKRKDPLRKATKSAKTLQAVQAKDTGSSTFTATAAKPRVKAKIKRQIQQKSHGRCEYKNHQTGKICGTHFLLQVDHIRPKAIGGSDNPGNLRNLCRAHNLLMAERNLGEKFMQNRRIEASKEKGPQASP